MNKAGMLLKMGSSPPPPTPSPDRKSARNMLFLFAVIAVLGVFTMAFSIVLGIVLLLVAEAFFAIAYRRFSGSSKSAK